MNSRLSTKALAFALVTACAGVAAPAHARPAEPTTPGEPAAAAQPAQRGAPAAAQEALPNALYHEAVFIQFDLLPAHPQLVMGLPFTAPTLEEYAQQVAAWCRSNGFLQRVAGKEENIVRNAPRWAEHLKRDGDWEAAEPLRDLRERFTVRTQPGSLSMEFVVSADDRELAREVLSLLQLWFLDDLRHKSNATFQDAIDLISQRYRDLTKAIQMKETQIQSMLQEHRFTSLDDPGADLRAQLDLVTQRLVDLRLNLAAASPPAPREGEAARPDEPEVTRLRAQVAAAEQMHETLTQRLTERAVAASQVLALRQEAERFEAQIPELASTLNRLMLAMQSPVPVHSGVMYPVDR